ncbi:hypothetical protein H072_9090 [Dactylellina haptotyla CBS 200.50]|uniref:N-acetyltransferase domain-containing protein n=1 Tax=Dactylellina haptotyla (strain CBS 200.50) TaxID=1284197 RepID=S8A2S3_DACHA|nr:hypothetical protein H072_9090 [Dactylellina haptotyla CBS 200.50]
MTSPYILRPGRWSDITEILEIQSHSLDDFAQAQFSYPFRRQYPNHFKSAMEASPRRKLAENGGKSFNIIIEHRESGKVAGWGFWRRNVGEEYENKMEKYSSIAAGGYKDAYSEGGTKEPGAGGEESELSNPAASRARLLLSNRCVIHDSITHFSAPHWYLSHLLVHPDFMRQGLGSILTLWGMRKAKDEGLPAFLTASVEGERLYSRLGWRQIGARTFPKLEDMSEKDRKAEEEFFGKEELEMQFNIAPPLVMEWGSYESDAEVFLRYQQQMQMISDMLS